jgi:hypothetical protein
MAQCQGAGKEGVAAKVLYRIKIGFTQAQQAEIGLEYVAIERARAHGKGRID